MLNDQDDWDIDRLSLFKAEIIKIFHAYNKPIQKLTIEAKADLTAETLSSLKTTQIEEFFKYVRSTEETLPNDGILKKILTNNYKRFSNYIPEEKQLEYDTEIISENLFKEFCIRMQKVSSGIMTADQAKEGLKEIQ